MQINMGSDRVQLFKFNKINKINLGKKWAQCVAYQGTNKIQPVQHLLAVTIFRGIIT